MNLPNPRSLSTIDNIYPEAFSFLPSSLVSVNFHPLPLLPLRPSSDPEKQKQIGVNLARGDKMSMIFISNKRMQGCCKHTQKMKKYWPSIRTQRNCQIPQNMKPCRPAMLPDNDVIKLGMNKTVIVLPRCSCSGDFQGPFQITLVQKTKMEMPNYLEMNNNESCK